MGPLRRRLTTAAPLLLPAPAWAGTCATIRPDWTAAAGPQGWLAETAYILASPPALILFLLLALALVIPRLWLAIPAALLTLAFAALLTVSRQSDMAALAQSEGCLATALPATILLVLAALLPIARALVRRRRRPA